MSGRGGPGGTSDRGFAFEKDSLRVLSEALASLEKGFDSLPALPGDGAGHVVGPGGGVEQGSLESVLAAAAERLRDNYPYFHPLYAGQMLKPPHPVARAAYALAMWINPNNHALDGGRASSAMEKEAVAEIAGMFGWTDHLGHLCGGGTMANLEALWVAGRTRPGGCVVASEQAHYTHRRISAVLGLAFEHVPADRMGRMDVHALEKRLARGGVGTVVATMGTTATGSVDSLPRILALRERYGFRLHADAAYGGYFGLTDALAPAAREAFDRVGEADSIVIDPHKHGLQPYGCGCVLFHDPTVGQLYKHDSPYTYFSSDALHLGEISLECSRPGAAAVALWATHRLLPPVRGGAFARGLARGRRAALALYERLHADERFVTAFPPELDIVVWTVAGKDAAESSLHARAIFEEAARRDLHLALAELPARFLDGDDGAVGHGQGARARADRTGMGGDRSAESAPGSPTVTCLRSVLMKPEHLDWIDRIWEILDEATAAALS